MWMPNFFKSLISTPTRQRPGRRPSTARLCLEALEDRVVPSWTVIDLGTLGGGFSEATDVNALAQVVGYAEQADGTDRAFLWQNGIMTNLGTLGGMTSRAYGINDYGQVVGMSNLAGDAYAYRAFLLTPEDTNGDGTPDLWFRDMNGDGANDLMRNLGTLGGANATSRALDVNNLGQVVGNSSSWDSINGGESRAFLWENGVMSDLGNLGGKQTTASAINDAGQITGVSSGHTFLLTNGVMTALGQSYGANDINSAGQLVDYDRWGRLWTPTVPNGTTGDYTVLGLLPLIWPDGGASSNAVAINNTDQVVGYQVDWDEDNWGNVSRGVLWANGTIKELPVKQAVAINDAGQIAGNKVGRAILLMPGSDGLPTIAISDVTVLEGNSGTTTATFTVTRSGDTTQEVTVTYTTADGTATAGSDYQAVTDTLVFAPGETTKTIPVLVYGDRLAEPTETFFVYLSGATNATIARSQGVGTIIDDEPGIFIDDVYQIEGNSGTTVFRFTVTLSAIYEQDVTVFFQTLDGTATAGSDYQATSGTLTFKAGETVAYIDVIVYGDTTQEADETFTVQLSGASSNAWLDDDLGMGWILNDDAEPTKPGNKGGKKK